jgi:hypothetical protein
VAIGDLNLDELDFADTDAIKAALSEGQTAYNRVKLIENQKSELLGEKKTVQAKYRELEDKLKSKGLSIDTLDTFDPSAGSDEQLQRFKDQLSQQEQLAASKTNELSSKLELAEKERGQLVARMERFQIEQHYNTVAPATGVNPDFSSDLLMRLRADGVQISIDQETGDVRGKRPNDVVDYALDTLLTNLKGDTKYQKYFMGKFGGGSGTNPNTGKAGFSNPFDPASPDLTEQTRLFRADPIRAMELQKLAGG